MSLFRSKESQDIEIVRAKLDAARAALAADQKYLAQRSLDLALAENDDATARTVAEVQARIAAARQKVEMLEAALSEGERLEANRLARAKAEAEKSRLRAMRQH